ncbi:MAG: exo-alpha-sialidase [Clostridia bacterium]|nr:exo-alpha-sialidase [Clostridia bacterium]
MKIEIGKEIVIARGCTVEEELWGSWQFPTPYRTKNGIAVSVHVAQDGIEHFKADTKRWYFSADHGASWQEADPAIAAECGLELPNGDRLFFPQTGAQDISDYQFTEPRYRFPDSDPTAQAAEGVLPLPDGVTFSGRKTVYGYEADRLPPSLAAKEWVATRITAAGAREERIPLRWPKLMRSVYLKEGKQLLRPNFPHGRARLGPDGAIWISTYTGEGHLDPETGRYSPYYSAQILRSEDGGKSFTLHAHMGYPADGSADYPYLSGGFSDNDFEFMPDGSMVWFLRSAWMLNTTYEWAPMYLARSEDGGKSWSKPIPFANTGIFPSLCSLKDGRKLLCYARPGIFLTASEDESGKAWCEPVTVMTPDDRSALANVPPAKKEFHHWDGGCNNPQLLALDDGSALLFYSDFYYPDEQGTKRKTILCRRITIES